MISTPNLMILIVEFLTIILILNAGVCLVTSTKGGQGPKFVGLHGQTFQVNGINNGIYNLITDQEFQLNAKFHLIKTSDDCPILPSTQEEVKLCWSEPGNYITELGIMSINNEKILIKAGDSLIGFTVEINNKKVIPIYSDYIFNYTSTHEITLNLGHFMMYLENVDEFLNIKKITYDFQRTLRLRNKPHGLIGQTWRLKTYEGSMKEIQGEVEDYLITDHNLFGTSFIYNRFTPHIKS